MSERDEALLFKCDEAACREDPMFYEVFTMDDRWSIIRAILDAAFSSVNAMPALVKALEEIEDMTSDTRIVDRLAEIGKRARAAIALAKEGK